MSMLPTYEHFGWPVSPYSAKTRTYLRHKRIPFVDMEPSGWMLMRTIKRAVGRAVMPTVRRPDGSWLQDTSEIIDYFESRYPDRGVVPETPKQRVASYLLELLGDEWLVIPIMHTRWNVAENVKFIEGEFARYGAPGIPSVLGKRVAAPIAKKMSSYLPVLGVSDETKEGIERYLRDLIAALDGHFGRHNFLFGTRPSIADFSLFGPLCAHVFRDPGSKHYIAGAPAVKAWFGRLMKPPPGRGGAWLDDDEVPESLDPIFEALFRDQWPYLEAVVAAIDRYCADNPAAPRVPRSLGETPFTIGGARGTRRLLTFSQWMLQRPSDAFNALDSADQRDVEAWLARVGGAQFPIEIRNRFERHRFRMRLADRHH